MRDFDRAFDLTRPSALSPVMSKTEATQPERNDVNLMSNELFKWTKHVFKSHAVLL
jgi:hypothetical protein